MPQQIEDAAVHTLQSRAGAGATASRDARDDQEDFNFDVSGSDDDNDNPPVSRHRTQAIVSVTSAQEINNPEVSVHSKNAANDVWYFFEKIGDKSICKVCRAIHDAKPEDFPSKRMYVYAIGNSTTTLRGHLDNFHLAEYTKIVEKNGWKNQLRSVIRSQAIRDDTVSAPRSDQFNKERFHEFLVRFIVVDDQSLNIMDCREFRALLLLLRSDLKEKMIPHRSKIRELVIDGWKVKFQLLRHDLAAAVGRISFTADVWSDRNRRSYLALTAHWIGRVESTTSLVLRAALIAFQRLRGDHDGRSLAATILQLLDRAQITANVGHFTLDNAANNGTMMEALAEMLEERDIPFNAIDRRINCYAHVINLCSGRVIKAIDNNDTPLESNPIGFGREVVRVIRVSGKRREAFEDTVKDGNKKHWFKAGNPPQPIQLKPLQLLRDVRTRWDSAYYLLNRLREMRPAVDHFLASPQNNDLAKYKISRALWKLMQDVEVVLSVPHTVQHIMSNEQTPILSGAIPSFETFMTRWENLIKKNPDLKPIITPGLECAYLYYGRMDRTQAYIIAMLLNPAIRMTWIRKHWDEEYIALAESKIRQTMQEYRARLNPDAQPAPADEGTSIPRFMSLAEQYGEDEMEIGEPRTSQSVEQEFISYVTAPLSGSSVDILKFWEINGSTFPTLFAMAMDYLPIQATSVPCERIFSSSAETDTKRRNRINPALMEALQMQKFQLKKERLDFMNGWVTEEQVMLEDDPDEDLLPKLFEGNAQTYFDRIIRPSSPEHDEE